MLAQVQEKCDILIGDSSSQLTIIVPGSAVLNDTTGAKFWLGSSSSSQLAVHGSRFAEPNSQWMTCPSYSARARWEIIFEPVLLS